MYRKNEIQLCPSPLYKCIVILVAAATLILTACGGLNGDDGEKNIRINLPPIEQSASGNSRALSDDRLPMLKTETKRYRVTVNDIVREGTESSYEFTLPVGIRATAIIECLNSSGEVIIRAVKDFTVSSGENSVDINLKNDGNEIMPASAAGRVTYSYGEADRHGNKSGIPSDPTTYSEGDLFEVKDGSGMTWDHGNFAGYWEANPQVLPEGGTADTTGSVSPGQKYQMPRGGVTLTAQWNKKSYTITYDMNASGSGGTQTSTSINQGSVQALEDYTIDSTTPQSVTAGGKNYKFMEWSDGNGNTYAVGRKITNVTGNITLTAQWSDKDVWTVTYNKGSTQETEQNITNWIDSDNAEDGNSVTLPTLQAAGYTFQGWQITGETGNKTGSYTPTASVTATAQWTVNSYQVTYALDGGSGGPANGNVQYNANVSLDAPTKTGYTFAGWSDGSTTYGGTSGNNSLSMPAQAITLTAQWTVNSYQVTYALDGGSGGPASENVQYNASIALDAPTKTGYTFTGWSDGSTTYGGTSGNNSLTMPAQAITLTAVWTPITYTITYDANGGGTNPGNTTFTVEDAYVTFASSATLQKQGYYFANWETTGGQDVSNMNATQLIAQISSGTTLALRAKWEINYKTDKADWAVGDIVCDNGNALTLANYNAVKTDTELSPAVAVVYKNDSANGKVYIVGKVHEKTGLAWAESSTIGHSSKITNLVTNASGSAGNLTFSGTYLDGSTGLAELKKVATDYSEANYPAWAWCEKYGTTNCGGTAFEAGWYFPSVAELFDIWKEKSSVEASLTAAGGSTFSSSWYFSSSQYDSYANVALFLDFDSGDWISSDPKNNGDSVCAVRQFTY